MSNTTQKPPAGWVGFDLDGTLAHYDHWRGIEHIGDPVPAMVDLVKQYLKAGVEVRIFTARVARELDLFNDESTKADYEEADLVRTTIGKWCEQHIGQLLPVTCSKDMHMALLYDDRCFQVEQNTGTLIADYYKDAADTMNGMLEEIRGTLGVAHQKQIVEELRKLVK